MRCSVTKLLAVGVLITNANAEQTPFVSLQPNITRQSMSCEETYGESWIPCGDEQSKFCYSPALGQTCCETDNGYCDAGTRCAPVPGHCCVDGEDLLTCAQNAGFEVPASVTLNDPVNSGPGRTSGVGLNASALHGTGVPNAMGPSSPYVQVSVAGKHHVAWMAAGIGAVGLFMFSC